MKIVNHFKVSVLPVPGVPNSYYLVDGDDGTSYNMYVTTAEGDYRFVGNSELVLQYVAQYAAEHIQEQVSEQIEQSLPGYVSQNLPSLVEAAINAFTNNALLPENAGGVLAVGDDGEITQDAGKFKFDGNKVFASFLQTGKKGTFNNSNLDADIGGVWSLHPDYAIDADQQTLGNQTGIACAYGQGGSNPIAPFFQEYNFLFNNLGVWGVAIGSHGSARFKRSVVIDLNLRVMDRIGIGVDASGDPRYRLLSKDTNNGGFNAHVQKTYSSVADGNIDCYISVLHDPTYTGTPGYSNVFQSYATAGVAGYVAGCNNFVGLNHGTDYSQQLGSYNPAVNPSNGFVAVELGPVFPHSEKGRWNNEGDFIVGWVLIDGGYTVNQTDDIVTLTQYTVPVNCVGKYFQYVHTDRVADRILERISNTQFRVETKRTRVSQAGRFIRPKVLVSKNGDVEFFDATRGLIFTSPNGKRWRQTVSDAGAAVITEITAATF